MNAKAAASRYQRQLAEVARQPGNDVCADCGGRNPRWASHNLGIFLCVQCAGVHRKMGTHISKVKSLTLDEWTKEQVDRMREYGNLRSNAYYNPDETRNRAPANVGDGERDSEVERFVRNKYQFRKFIDRQPPPVPQKDSSTSDKRPGISVRTKSSGSTRTMAAAVGSAEATSGWGTASHLSPIEMRNGSMTTHSPSTSSSTRVFEESSSAQGRDIHRSRTAPIPTTWQAAKRAVSPLPALPSAISSDTPTTSVSSTSTAPSSTMPYPNGQASSSPHLPSYAPAVKESQIANGNGLLSVHPSLPQRASSAQAFSQPTTNSQSSVGFSLSPSYLSPGAFTASSRPAPPTTSQSFSGRSAVFDDLLELTQPAAPVSSLHTPYDGGGGAGNAWSVMQTNGTAVNGTNGPTGVGMNPWAQQHQQLNGTMHHTTGFGQGSYFQQVQQPGSGTGRQEQPVGQHLSPQSLGGMAFSPQLYHPTQPQAQQQPAPFPQAQSLPAFGNAFGPPPPTNPFGIYQHQQQQQQPLQPHDTALLMSVQRDQSGQVFQDWTSRMMPPQQQQQPGGGGGGWR